MAEKSTIARPYAQAIFDLAASQERLAEWSTMLNLVGAIAADQAMGDLIGNPRVSNQQLYDVFADICGAKLDSFGQNLLRVLIENDRVVLLPEIAALFEAYKAEAEKTVLAQVTTAFELSKGQRKEIAAALKNRLGREVTLECAIDESLVGGAIIKAGDLVIDGSVTGQLDRLTNTLSQ